MPPVSLNHTLGKGLAYLKYFLKLRGSQQIFDPHFECSPDLQPGGAFLPEAHGVRRLSETHSFDILFISPLEGEAAL